MVSDVKRRGGMFGILLGLRGKRDILRGKRKNGICGVKKDPEMMEKKTRGRDDR